MALIFVPLKRVMTGKKETGQEGSGVPIPALYKVTLLLSALLVCTYISLKKVLQIKKMVWNHELIAHLSATRTLYNRQYN